MVIFIPFFNHNGKPSMKRYMFIALIALSCALPIHAQQKDDPACKDHPLFSRMPDSWIHNCDLKEFNVYDFKIGQAKTEKVEGKYWKINYYPQAAAKTKPSELQILRNFENAVSSLGGTVLYKEKSRETFRLAKDGKEVFVEVWAEYTGKYGLVIVEKASMAQDIVANADALLNNLRTTGHVAVNGIYFDTGRSEIRPESEKAVGEIAKLLKGDPGLQVYVVGHTDNIGPLDANMKLSQGRADAVVQALVRTHGIPASRLKSFGNGPFAPVATNATEDGRAQNRRVELVKQ
jgi:outer membrane protein OmpA-like peptidoglycan-associated protein